MWSTGSIFSKLKKQIEILFRSVSRCEKILFLRCLLSILSKSLLKISIIYLQSTPKRNIKSLTFSYTWRKIDYKRIFFDKFEYYLTLLININAHSDRVVLLFKRSYPMLLWPTAVQANNRETRPLIGFVTRLRISLYLTKVIENIKFHTAIRLLMMADKVTSWPISFVLKMSLIKMISFLSFFFFFLLEICGWWILMNLKNL